MHHARLFLLALLAVGILAGPSEAQPQPWHKSIEDGVAAASKSNKPLLLITAWKRTL